MEQTMRIESVTINGYGAFSGSHTFRVHGQGLVLVEGRNLDEPRMRSNGAGKSTVWDAVDWCLFGEVPRGEVVDSVVHDGGKSCTVEVNLLDEDSGEHGLVTRARPSALTFSRNGEDRTCQDTDETQARVLEWLGLDREVFHAVALFAQTDLLHFADATDGGRMDILSKVLPELAEIDAIENPAKRARDAMQSEVEAAERRLAEVTGALQALRGVTYEEQTRSWDLAHADRLARLESQLVQIGPEAQRLQGLASGLQASRDEVAVLEARGPEAQVPATTPELERLRVEVTRNAAAHGAAVGEHGRLGREREKMRAMQMGRCSQCGSVVTPEHVAAELARLDEAVEQARCWVVTHAVGLDAAQNAVRREEGRLGALRAEREAREHAVLSQKMEARRRLVALQTTAAEAERLGRMATEISTALFNVRAEVNPWHQEEERRQGKIAGVEAQVQGLQAARDAAAEEVRYAEFWVRAAGARGLKSYVLDARLTELTNAANEWVKLLTGGTFWVRFESQKLSKKKTLSNAPSVRVFKYLPDGTVIERGYKTFSGGEKRRIAWAIDFGLSRLVARRARKRWDLLVLDEVFAHVDAAGGQAIVEMLHALRQEKSSIFVVEHDADFRSAFERVWVVEKQGGCSRIITEEMRDERREAEGGEAGRPADAAAGPKPEAAPGGGRVPRRGAVRRRVQG
jgi:DNA repair exonuclease SbcCD ATPase subunit